MGLDGTIKRPDAQPLGTVAEVQKALSGVFAGLTFNETSSGLDMLQAAAEMGVVFPDSLLEHYGTKSVEYRADFEGTDFSIEFYMDNSGIISEVGVVLRGTTTHSDFLFALLEERFGWIITFP